MYKKSIVKSRLVLKIGGLVEKPLVLVECNWGNVLGLKHQKTLLKLEMESYLRKNY